MYLHLLQYAVAWEDPEANFRRVRDHLRAAAPASPGLLLLPEMFATGYSMNTSVTTAAAPETVDFLAAVAREYGLHVLAGLAMGSPTDASNQALLLDSAGGVVGAADKLQPFTFAGEDQHYKAGEAAMTLPAGELRVSPFVCYDLRFPEHFRVVAPQAQLLAVIANWPAARAGHWRTLLQARAIENQAYVAGVNRVGSDPNVAYRGDSMVVDPRGEVLLDAGEADGVFSVAIEPALVDSCRERFPALGDMRTLS